MVVRILQLINRNFSAKTKESINACRLTACFLQPEHKSDTENQLQYRGHRCCQPDMEQRGIRLDTHNIRYRHSDAECTKNSLYHNKSCSANSIIESGVEEDSSEQTVNCIGFQVICGSCDYFRGGGENTRQDISVEEGNYEHYNTDGILYIALPDFCLKPGGYYAVF